MGKYLLSIITINILFINSLQAQYTEKLTYGIKVSALHSTISNLPEMIIGRDNSLTTYTINSKGYFGIEGGLFLNYKVPNSRVGLQPEILYRNSGETIAYKGNEGKEYELKLKYSYLLIGAFYKVYPIKGANVGIGAFYGLNLTPNNLDYKSNESGGQYDIENRQFFRDGISGRNDLSICFSLGYELEKSIHFDVRYYFGVSDVVESREASFQFIENTNRSNVLALSIGYSFDKW
jgi:hypothetical protein